MKQTLRKVGLASAVSLLAGVGYVTEAAPASAAPLSCGATVNVSTTLTSDIGPCTGDGLKIGKNKITLDLNGHQILGDGSSPTPWTGTASGYQNGAQVGVRVSGRTGVKVIDSVGTGRISFFNAGVVVEAGSGNTVQGVTTTDNRGCDSNDFTETGFAPDACNANNLGDGIVVAGSAKNTVTGNTVMRNGNFNVASGGISLIHAASQNTVSANTVRDNGNTGIRVESGGGLRNVLSNNTSSANGSCGAFFGRTFCGGNGVSLSFGAGFSRVVDNTFEGNRGSGVGTSYDSDHSYIGGNTISANRSNGVALGANHTDVENNTITANLGSGVTVPGGSVFGSEEGNEDFIRRHNAVRANTITGNGGHGVFVLCPRDNSTTGTGGCLTGSAELATTEGKPIQPYQYAEILDNTSTGNGGAGAGVSRWDLFDANVDCAKNTWNGNTYKTANPACTTTGGTQV